MDIVRSCYKSIGEQQRPWSSKHAWFGLKVDDMQTLVYVFCSD